MTEKYGQKAWAYVVEEEGEETILELETDEGPYPMIGMDRESAAAVAEYAQLAANGMGQTVTLIEFTGRREVRQFTPQKKRPTRMQGRTQ